jgi:hypothetical protein
MNLWRFLGFREEREPDADVREVDATVVALVPEFHQAKIRSGDGHLYAITKMTRGVQLESLREGQHVRCLVTVRLPRVLTAEVIA